MMIPRMILTPVFPARAVESAGPVTLSVDIGIIKLVLQHAAAVHGLWVSVEAVDLAR